MTDTSSSSGYAGQQGLNDDTSDFNKVAFQAKQLIALISTATLVEIVSCTNAGGVAPFGYVDVQPLVNLIDGMGNSSPHREVHTLPYFRLQGGANAVIIDPAPGDIGIAVFADRDISSVKSTQAQANPGSRRRFSMADGIYIGGVLNGVPKQYVQFTATGINIVDMNGNVIAMKPGSIAITGNLTVTGNVTAGFGGTYVDLLHHVHQDSGGEGDGGPPVGNS